MFNKSKWFKAIFRISLVFLLILVTANYVIASAVTLPDSELIAIDHQNSSRYEVYLQWGAASEISRMDMAGAGVAFTVSGLGGSGAGWGDVYELNSLAGGTSTHNADFTAYNRYEMFFTNQSAYTINVHLFMNTGFTNNGANPEYDTFWAGPWVQIPASQTVMAYLDFSNAETYNAYDDPNSSWQYTNGTWNSIHRLNEVTNIGFELADFDSDASGGQIGIVAMATPIPTSVLLLGSGMLGLIAMRRRKK